MSPLVVFRSPFVLHVVHWIRRRVGPGGAGRAWALAGVLCGLFVVAPDCAPSASAESLEVGRMVRPVVVADHGTLRLEVPSGNVALKPASVDAVELEIVLRCSGSVARCRADADQVELMTSTEGETTVVGIAGPSSYGYSGRWIDRFFVGRAVTRCGQQVYGGEREGTGRGGWRLEIDLLVRYPRDQALELLVGEGQVTLERHEGAVRLDLGAVDATIRMPKRVVADLELRTKRGRAALGGVERQTLRGKKLLWSGEGDHPLIASVDRGDLSVSLY